MDAASLPSHHEYQIIAHAMDYLLQHQQQQPELSELAKVIGYSETHMQRLFSQWVGVSPKRFLQYLTLQQAQQQLQYSSSVLDLSQQLGLSSAGRLYDLFVSVQAVTPGEAKMQGEGLVIHYGWGHTPFGCAFIASTSRGICQLSFCESEQADTALHELKLAWPKAELLADQSQAQSLLKQVFSQQQLLAKPLSLWLKGTNFQLQVWQALLNIPYGHVCSYQFLAEHVSSAKATRAVASAVAKNPIAYIIPCHRVIRSNGALGGYRWGLSRKQLMMGREAQLKQREE